MPGLAERGVAVRWLGIAAVLGCLMVVSGCSWISPAYVVNLTGETLRIGGKTDALKDILKTGEAYRGYAWCSKDIDFKVWAGDAEYEFELSEIEQYRIGGRDFVLILLPESLNTDPAKRKFGQNARKR